MQYKVARQIILKTVVKEGTVIEMDPKEAEQFVNDGSLNVYTGETPAEVETPVAPASPEVEPEVKEEVSTETGTPADTETPAEEVGAEEGADETKSNE